MHLVKYGRDYTRLRFLESLGKTALSAGMLPPLWEVVAKDGDIGRAYPDEALSIEAYTGGAIQTGNVIDPGNVEAVRDLIDPLMCKQINTDGRIIHIAPTTTELDRLSPRPSNEATLKYRGQCKLDADGNVRGINGDRWPGGNPFPDGGTAQKIVAANTLSLGVARRCTLPNEGMGNGRGRGPEVSLPIFVCRVFSRWPHRDGAQSQSARP